MNPVISQDARCQVQDMGIFPYCGNILRQCRKFNSVLMDDRLVDTMLQCNEDPYWVEVVAIGTPVILYSLIFVALACLWVAPCRGRRRDTHIHALDRGRFQW